MLDYGLAAYGGYKVVKSYKASVANKASGAGGLGSGNNEDFSNIQGTSVDDILSRIPKDANKRVLTS